MYSSSLRTSSSSRPFSGSLSMDLEELVVGMHIPEEIKGFLFVRHSFLVFVM